MSPSLRFVTVCSCLLVLAGCGQSQETTTTTDSMTTAVPESLAAPPDTGLAGTWVVELPAASSPGRLVTLDLQADGPARLSQDYRKGEIAIVETGTWEPLPDGRVRVVLNLRDAEAIPPVTLVFVPEPGHLRAVEFDRHQWGEQGLRLARLAPPPQDTTAAGSKDVAAILGRKWKWIRTVTPVETFVSPDPPSYTFELDTDGRVAVQADCNRGVSGYTMDGSALELRPVALTRRACGPRSLGERFAAQLGAGRHWFMRGDTLYMDLMADSGTMAFIASD